MSNSQERVQQVVICGPLKQEYSKLPDNRAPLCGLSPAKLGRCGQCPTARRYISMTLPTGKAEFVTSTDRTTLTAKMAPLIVAVSQGVIIDSRNLTISLS